MGERDKIVVAYTRGYGKLRGTAAGARSIKSAFAGRLEPLNWVEMHFFEKEGRDLVSIDNVELLRSFSSSLQDYRSFLQLSYLAELMLETTPEREPNDALFRLLVLVLDGMQDWARSDLAQIYFQVWHLKISGLFPSSGKCRQCGAPLNTGGDVFFSSQCWGFSCADCKGLSSERVPGKEFMLLGEILTKPLKNVECVVWSADEYPCLGRLVEKMIQSSFERSFESLSLVCKENNLN